MKCKVKMTDRVRPVPGSVKGVTDTCTGTGTCPSCETPGVVLSIVGGFIRAHVVSATETPENNPQPATLVEPPVTYGKGLSEPVTGLTDTGVRIGDPRAAELRRVAEIEGAAGIGVVQVPRKVPGKGKLKSGAPRMTTKMLDVPATEEHVREALDYWRNRRLTERTSDAIRRKQVEMVSSLSRRLEAIMRAQEVRYNTASRTLDVVAMTPVVEQLPLSASIDAAQGHRGPTLVRGRAMNADTVKAPRERKGDKPVRPTFDGPLGRERFDRKITDVPEPVPVLSRSQKRNLRRKRTRDAYVTRVAQGK